MKIYYNITDEDVISKTYWMLTLLQVIYSNNRKLMPHPHRINLRLYSKSLQCLQALANLPIAAAWGHCYQRMKSGSCLCWSPSHYTVFHGIILLCIHFVPSQSISVYRSIIEDSHPMSMWPIIDRFLRRCIKSLVKNVSNRSKPEDCLTIAVFHHFPNCLNRSQ